MVYEYIVSVFNENVEIGVLSHEGTLDSSDSVSDKWADSFVTLEAARQVARSFLSRMKPFVPGLRMEIYEYKIQAGELVEEVR